MSNDPNFDASAAHVLEEQDLASVQGGTLLPPGLRGKTYEELQQLLRGPSDIPPQFRPKPPGPFHSPAGIVPDPISFPPPIK